MEELFYIGNIKNPKLVFVLLHPISSDYNFKTTETPLQGSNSSYVLFRGMLNDIGVSIKDVCVFFCYPSADLKKFKQRKTINRDKLVKFVNENYRDKLFKLMAEMPEDTIFILVGGSVSNIVLNIKNIVSLSGNIKERNVYAVNDKGKKITKKIKCFCMLDPISISVNVRKYKPIFLKSVSYLQYILNPSKYQSNFKYKILKPDEAVDFIYSLKGQEYIYLDTETSGLEYGSDVVGVSIALEDQDCCYYIPLYDCNWFDENENPIIISDINKTKINTAFKEVLSNIGLIGFNIKFDVVQMLLAGCLEKYNIVGDLYVGCHLKYNNSLTSYSLKEICRLFFNVYEDWDEPIYKKRVEYSKLHKMKLADVPYSVVDTEILGKYACYDVYYTKKLWHKIRKEFTKKELEHYNNLMDALNQVVKWEEAGVYISINKLKELYSNFSVYLLDLQNKINEIPSIYKKFKGNLNINSTSQLAEATKKDCLDLPVIKKTKTGVISLSSDVLQEYLERPDDLDDDSYNFIEYLNTYKVYNKLYRSYIKPLYSVMSSGSGIYRTSFNVCGTVTGRISSAFHTIPSRTDLGKKIKSIVHSRWEDSVIISADYSQLEPRMLASLSGDELLQKVYKEGKDIYKYLASVVYDIDYNEVEKPQRNAMKSLVLALLYGMSPSTFAHRVGISLKEAEIIFNNFFKRFSKVKVFIDNIIKEGFKRKGILTPFGRFIPVNTYSRYDAERKFRNYIIQSTASEFALFRFGEITKAIHSDCVKVIGSVHDSIIIDCRLSKLFKTYTTLKYYSEVIIFKEYPFIKVPFKLDIGLGVSWGECLDIKRPATNGFVLEGSEDNYLKLKEKVENYGFSLSQVQENEFLLVKNS